jgi:hypothetical protein
MKQITDAAEYCKIEAIAEILLLAWTQWGERLVATRDE